MKRLFILLFVVALGGAGYAAYALQSVTPDAEQVRVEIAKDKILKQE